MLKGPFPNHVAFADLFVLLIACARVPARASGPITFSCPATPDSRPTSPAAPNTPVGGQGPQAMSEEQIFVLLEEALGTIGNCNRTLGKISLPTSQPCSPRRHEGGLAAVICLDIAHESPQIKNSLASLENMVDFRTR